MSALAFFTWLAIGVLIVGSTAVFAWFLVEVWRGRRRGRRPGGGEPPRPASRSRG